MTDSYTYDAFGAITSHTGTSAQPLTFTGQQQDTNAARGLLDLHARSYDPGLGRFVSQDPLPFLQRYAYAGSDPVNLEDPFGLCSIRHPRRCVQDASRRAVQFVSSPVNIASTAQLVAGVGITVSCGPEDLVPAAGAVCAGSVAAYVGASAAKIYLEDSAHAKVVASVTSAIGVVPAAGCQGKAIAAFSDALDDLAEPGRAEAPGADGGKLMPGAGRIQSLFLPNFR